MTKWQEVKLGDICTILNGRAYKQEELLDNGKYSVLRVGNFFSRDKWYYSNLELEENKYCDNGDLLFAWSASFGPKIWDGGKVIYHYHIWKMLPNPQVLDKYYLFCWLQKSVSQLTQGIHGSVMAHLTKSDMENILLTIPPLEVQKKIAGVLGALDDKIELNNKINNNLEQQAQALFNEKIVNNSKQGCIGDYCSIKSGFAFKSSWWQNTGVRVIKIKNIEPSGLNIQECSFVSEDKVSIAKEFIVKGGDLLIAMTGATIGKFAIVPHVDEILLVNQRVGKFFLGDNPLEKLPFIYCTLKQPEVVSEIINRGQGSAQPNISGNDIMSITCNYPDENIIAGFNNICRPYFEKIITNQYENTRLAAIRDALLPKLMSGEIDVSSVSLRGIE